MKLIKFCSIALLLLLSLCSCKNEIDNPTDIVPEEIEVFVPVFGEMALSNTRGLTDMLPPDNKFDDDFGAATAVMSYYPQFTNIKNFIVDTNNIEEFISKLGGKIFGYDVIPYINNCKLDSDGLFLRFGILENGIEVGRIDYFYEFDGLLKRKFSYRQFVGLNLQMSDGTFNDTSVLAIEYLDIPIYGNGNYTLGLDEKGNRKDNAIIDMFTFYTNNGYETENGIIDDWNKVEYRLTRKYPIARMEDGIMHLTLDSMKEETVNIENFFFESLEDGKTTLKDIMNQNQNGNKLQIDSEEEAKKFNIHAIFQTMGQYYKNINMFNRTYKTSDDFRKATIKDLKNKQTPVESFKASEFLIFNPKTGENASLTKWGSDKLTSYNFDTSPYLILNKSLLKEDEFKKRGYELFGYKFNQDPTSFIQTFIDKIGIKDVAWKAEFENFIKESLSN